MEAGGYSISSVPKERKCVQCLRIRGSNVAIDLCPCSGLCPMTSSPESHLLLFPFCLPKHSHSPLSCQQETPWRWGWTGSMPMTCPPGVVTESETADLAAAVVRTSLRKPYAASCLLAVGRSHTPYSPKDHMHLWGPLSLTCLDLSDW